MRILNRGIPVLKSYIFVSDVQNADNVLWLVIIRQFQGMRALNFLFPERNAAVAVTAVKYAPVVQERKSDR